MTKKNKKSKGKGWFGDSYKHALASKGIKTSNLNEKEAKKLASSGLLDQIEGKEGEGWGLDLKKDAKVKKKKAKELKKEAKELKKKARKGDESLASKLKTKVGKLASKTSDKAKSVKDKLSAKEDEVMGEIIGDDIKKGLKDAVERNVGGNVDKEEAKKIIENGTPKELLEAIRKGDIIDAGAIHLSDENSRELGQHLGDLKHDLSLTEDKLRLLKDTKNEMERYAKKEYKNFKSQLKDEWNDIKTDLEDDERKEKANEYNHILEMKRIDLNRKVIEPEARYNYAKEKYEALKEIYENRKDFTSRWLT